MMSENKKRILEMLAGGKITVDEAEKLLALTASDDDAARTGAAGTSNRKVPFKYLRVEVRPGPKAEGSPQPGKVNIRVPINLIRAGMKLTALIPPQAADKVHDALLEKGIDYDLRNVKPDDLDEFLKALGDLEVDVEDGKEKVHVYAE
ncbi:MAG: hypothetical protein AB1597_02665 [Chloroflexota bacterium]